MTDSKKDDKEKESGPENTGDKTESPDVVSEILKLYPGGKQALVKMMFGAVSTVSKVATEVSEKVEKTLSSSPGHKKPAKAIHEAGEYLKELREVAGLTLKELSDAVKLPDQSLLTAAENGTATLSFELILRLAALLARHDPIPFIIRLTQTYKPDIWAVLENWGLERLERERQFVSIYRTHDEAGKLSDKEFQRVLEFTSSAFEMALKFAEK